MADVLKCVNTHYSSWIASHSGEKKEAGCLQTHLNPNILYFYASWRGTPSTPHGEGVWPRKLARFPARAHSRPIIRERKRACQEVDSLCWAPSGKGELDKQEHRSYPLLTHMHTYTQSLLDCQGFGLINFQPDTNPKMRKHTIAGASD